VNTRDALHVQHALSRDAIPLRNGAMGDVQFLCDPRHEAALGSKGRGFVVHAYSDSSTIMRAQGLDSCAP
jgi:hypothetical protein